MRHLDLQRLLTLVLILSVVHASEFRFHSVQRLLPNPLMRPDEVRSKRRQNAQSLAKRDCQLLVQKGYWQNSEFDLRTRFPPV